ncbi:MAG: ABC transporter ATP-binding protein [Tissierellia bacterium]|nr:ABC transporter ATP-binding protein [Tissierellia bacterium]
MSVLEVKNVDKYYGTGDIAIKVLDGVSFSVEQNEFTAIMGPSGSGKTTLLNMISTIDTVSAGNIFINGMDITEEDEDVLSEFRGENLGFIFQDFNLLDILTVRENIELSLSIKGEKPIMTLEEISKLLGITEILDKYPKHISGGEKQRCAFARAFINSPKLILADEPTGSLDSNASRTILKSMELLKEKGATILVVTHDAFVSAWCDRVLFLRDGKIWKDLYKSEKTNREFYNKIVETMSVLGGDINDF